MKVTLRPRVTYDVIIEGKSYGGFVRQGEPWNGMVRLTSTREGKVVIIEEPQNVKAFFGVGDDDLEIAEESVEMFKLLSA